MLESVLGHSLISLSVRSCSVFCSLYLSCVVHRDAGPLFPLPLVPPEQDPQQEQEQETQSSPDESCSQSKTVVSGMVHLTSSIAGSTVIHCNHTNLCNVVYVAQFSTPLVLPKLLPLLPTYCHNVSIDIRMRCTPLNYNLWPIPGHWFQAWSLWRDIM